MSGLNSFPFLVAQNRIMEQDFYTPDALPVAKEFYF